jgi:hypothetical protein
MNERPAGAEHGASQARAHQRPPSLPCYPSRSATWPGRHTPGRWPASHATRPLAPDRPPERSPTPTPSTVTVAGSHRVLHHRGVQHLPRTATNPVRRAAAPSTIRAGRSGAANWAWMPTQDRRAEPWTVARRPSEGALQRAGSTCREHFPIRPAVQPLRAITVAGIHQMSCRPSSGDRLGGGPRPGARSGRGLTGRRGVARSPLPSCSATTPGSCCRLPIRRPEIRSAGEA